VEAGRDARREGSDGEGRRRRRLAVFVSGGGSNLRALHAATVDGSLDADIVMVVSDKPGCGGWLFGEEHGMETVQYPLPKGAEVPVEGVRAAATPEALVETLTGAGVELCLLAGYLKLVPRAVCAAFPRAILNIHPALLPAFGGKGYHGLNVHRAVVDSGARVTGPTVHFVNERFDEGKIVAQRTVHVFPEDTAEEVAARVLAQEHALFAEVAQAWCEDRIEFRPNGVPAIRPKADAALPPNKTLV